MTEDWTRAQQSVIGSALVEPSCVPMLLRECRAEDLSGQYRTLFEAIRALSFAGEPIDPVTLLAKVGPAYADEIRRLMIETPTAANAAAYAKICTEQARLTRIRSLAMELGGAITLEEASGIIQKLMDANAERQGHRVTGMMDAWVDFVLRHQEGEKEYVSFGLPGLDANLTADFGDVVVLGGYPSDGKSALMLQMAWHMGKFYRVGIFSFETVTQKLMDRTVTQAVPGVSFGHVKHNTLDAQEWKAITAAGSSVEKHRLELIEAAGMDAADVLATALARRYEIIFLDYVQLIRPNKRRGGTRAEEIAEISMALATMARRHRILIVELSQLTRPMAGKGGKIPPPNMSSLRESGQLEQDADVVMLLYRTNPDSAGSPRQLRIAKNKEGRLGLIDLIFDGSSQRFTEGRDDDGSRLEGEARKRRERERQGVQEELPL